MAFRYQRAALRRRDLLGWVATAVLLGGGRAASPAASATRLRGAAGKERYLPDADPAKTMLGAAQWRWLEA